MWMFIEIELKWFCCENTNIFMKIPNYSPESPSTVCILWIKITFWSSLHTIICQTFNNKLEGKYWWKRLDTHMYIGGTLLNNPMLVSLPTSGSMFGEQIKTSLEKQIQSQSGKNKSYNQRQEKSCQCQCCRGLKFWEWKKFGSLENLRGVVK